MWYLFQDLENSSKLYEMVTVFLTAIISYFFALWMCKKLAIMNTKYPILGVVSGLMVSFLFSIIYFSFATFLLLSLIFTWLSIRKLLSIGGQ